MFKALIVDDSKITSKVTAKLLSPYAECEFSYDGEDAVIAYQRAFAIEAPFQLICLDIEMPKLSGTQALKQIREFERNNNIEGQKRVKIIMTTASSQANDVHEAIKSGCESYLIKPVVALKIETELVKLGLIRKSDIIGM